MQQHIKNMHHIYISDLELFNLPRQRNETPNLWKLSYPNQTSSQHTCNSNLGILSYHYPPPWRKNQPPVLGYYPILINLSREYPNDIVQLIHIPRVKPTT